MITTMSRGLLLAAAGLVCLAVGHVGVRAEEHERHHHDSLPPPPPVTGTIEGTFKAAGAGAGTVPSQAVTIEHTHFLTGNIQLATPDLFPLSPLEGRSTDSGHVRLHSESADGSHFSAHGTMTNGVMSLAFEVEDANGAIVDAGLMSLTLTLDTP